MGFVGHVLVRLEVEEAPRGVQVLTIGDAQRVAPWYIVELRPHDHVPATHGEGWRCFRRCEDLRGRRDGFNDRFAAGNCAGHSSTSVTLDHFASESVNQSTHLAPRCRPEPGRVLEER